MSTSKCCRPITIIARSGYAVFSRSENAWATAWRRSNHSRRLFLSEMVVMTPSGWHDTLGDAAGSTPALARD